MIDAARAIRPAACRSASASLIAQAKLRSYQGIVPKSDNWRTLGASDEEIRALEGVEEDETEREMARAAGWALLPYLSLRGARIGPAGPGPR